MQRKLFITLAVVIAIGLATSGILYAFSPANYSDEDINTEVKKIDKGIQITLTSDDSEVAKDIQENVRWYMNLFKHGVHNCPYVHSERRFGYRTGCMW